MKRLKQFLLNQIADGKFDDADVETVRLIIYFNIGTSLGITALIIFGTIVLLKDANYLLWAFDSFFALLLCILIIYVRKTKQYQAGIDTTVGLYSLICWYLAITGGDNGTGYSWFYTYPLVAFFGLGARKGAMATVILLLPLLVLFNLDNPPGIIADYTVQFRTRFVGTYAIIAVLAFMTEQIRANTHLRLIRKNRELNEAIYEIQKKEENLRRVGYYLEREVEKRTAQYREANIRLLQEIDERARIEEALRESEEKFRLIAENTADVITVFDMDMNVTYVSPSSERVRGFTFEEARHQTLEQVMTPESIKKVLAVYEDEMALEASGNGAPNRVRIVELQEYRKDGSLIWVEDSFSFLRNENQEAMGILSVARDITERKQAEEDKVRLEKQLMQAQKLEAVGTLAGGLAHDFNNLLMTIQGYASLMLLETEASHPHHDRLRQMELQVAHGASLTRQLLGFARGGRYELKPINLNTVIDRTLSMFSRTMKETDVCADFNWEVRTVEADQGQIEQVLMNLFVNAGQAMPSGGVLTVETDNCTVDEDQALLNDLTPGPYVRISVSDTGTGMDENTIKRIFDPFFSTKGMGRGTGLGLAMVYGIIKGHQGMIDVVSALGKGSTFNIYLPASDKLTATAEQAIPEEILAGTETLLLVDDEESVLEVSAELLSTLGYRIYAAGSGQEAIAIFMEKGKEIDLVILDMIMPGISGAETFEQLREINPHVRVLLSSGYSIDGQAQMIMNRGCKGFLQKPFELKTLSRKVRETLNA